MIWGITATAVGALLMGAAAATPFMLSGLANENVLYTKIPEGTGKIIVKGKSFHRAVLSFKGYHLNDPRVESTFDASEPEWEILPNSRDLKYDTRPPFTRTFGLYWVGIPGMRSVYNYRFAWNEYEEVESGSQHLLHRDERTEVFMANDFPYVMVLEDAKTADNIPVRAEFVVIVRITNPHKALFESNDWLSQLESYVLNQGRNFIGSFTYDELRSETDDPEKADVERKKDESFSRPIRELTSCLPEEKDLPEDQRKGTKRSFGITVKAGNLESIVMSGPAAVENERLSVARYTAERHAEATVIGAKAEADAVRTKADAQAYATTTTGEAEVKIIKARIETFAADRELGQIMLVTDALAKPGDGKVIVVPSNITDVIGKIAEKVKG